MDKSFFDIIEHEKNSKQITVSEYLTFEQAEEIVGKCYPEHVPKLRKSVSLPYVIITNEKYATGKDIRRKFYQSMW